MASIVLVHGAWHDGSAWDQLSHHLQAKGHRAFAPTMAGHGKGVNKRVNHADCTRSIVDFIVREGLSDFILVGHSFGGTVIPKVAEAVPERIRRLVFINGFVLLDGQSLVENVPPPTAAAFSKWPGIPPTTLFCSLFLFGAIHLRTTLTSQPPSEPMTSFPPSPFSLALTSSI